eukprot:CAMPEP_0184498678 /NCGR_PEP_ID=MMETSP0113_2-20130426/39536_1 /TAXON_ID=91329 /ORGANISM="Norrisiella sphaerica, Strain BC52" /LENGTH=633 /DNA_ID=CAMNT_0026886295 /DNA_START=342 /DNA_END=2243 /DNA_ORIENTATION=+
MQQLSPAENSPNLYLSSPDSERRNYGLAVLPENETNRLEELRSLEILDTEREDVFNSILWLATNICGTEKGAVSLVDKDRQWFKARKGLKVDQTSRDVSFCSHAILQPDKMLVVPDASTDQRFAANPLVTDSNGPKIRFYAGTPLSIGEFALGTLCVMSSEPKELTDAQSIALTNLGRLAQDQLLIRKKNTQMRRRVEELQKAEQSLIEAKNEAQRAEMEKRQFLANMTHELRTPLNSIVGYSQLLKESSNSARSAEDLESIDCICFGSEVLRNTIDSVLDYVSLTNEGKVEMKATNIFKVIQSISSLQESVAKKKKVAFQTKLDPTLHAGVYADQMKITQISNNFLSNAIKFTPAKKKVVLSVSRISSDKKLQKPEVTIFTGRCKLPKGTMNMKHHYMLLEVIDEGSGISKDMLLKIFESFQQEKNSTARTHGGTGLGLAIVKELTRMMEGWIYVDSSPKGSCFCVIIPYTPCEIKEAELTTEGGILTKYPRNVKVLVAEDDFLSQKLLGRFFIKNYIEHIICPNGRVLVEAVKEVLKDSKTFLIVIADIGMPIMGGIEAFEKIKKLYRELDLSYPIMALTASPESLREHNPGFDTILAKPVNFKELKKLLDAIVLRQMEAAESCIDDDNNE